MKSILIKDTTREEREQIVKQALWGIYGEAAEPNVNSAPAATTGAAEGLKRCISRISTVKRKSRKSTRNIPHRL